MLLTEKKLPINLYPPIVGYSSHAKALAILSTNQNYIPWFYSNYIQLWSKKKFDNDMDLDFYMGIRKDTNFYSNHPLLYSQTIKKSLINKVLDITDFVIASLEDNFYVDLYVDEFYLAFRDAYNKKHVFHDILIFGFDKERRVFFVMAYNVTYQQFEITFDDLFNAYSNCPIEKWYQSIYLYNIEEHQNPYYKYEFDLNHVIKTLEDFLLSKNSSCAYTMFNNKLNDAFGLDVYTFARESVRTGILNRDIRALHILWEHKKIMLGRIIYLRDQGYLTQNAYELLKPKYESIEKKLLIGRNSQLKYQVIQKPSLLDRVYDILGFAQDEDALITENLIKSLQ